MDNFTPVLENLNGLKDLEQTNPDYFEFIKKYFTEQGGTAEEVKDVKDLNVLGMKMIYHYIGNALSSLDRFSYYYQKNHDEKAFFDNATRNLIKISDFILSVPDEVWTYMIKRHGLDSTWNDFGQRLRDLSINLKENLSNRKADALAENIDDLFKLYREATNKNAFA